MCQNINMNPYKGFYVNECLVTLLEFHLSLKYNAILLKQAKQSNQFMQNYTDKRKQSSLLDERGFHFSYICLVHVSPDF